MSRLAAERETTITFNEEEAAALVWSASPRFIRHMEKLGVQPYKTAHGAEGREDEGAAWYRVPKTWVKVRRPKTMHYTAEQRQALAERMRNLHRPGDAQIDTVTEDVVLGN